MGADADLGCPAPVIKQANLKPNRADRERVVSTHS